MAITVETRTQVSQLYTALFGRAPDADGLGFWTQLVGNGDTLTHVADMMYATAPARAYYPAGATNQQVVAAFYLNVLGRTADAEGLAFWTAAMNEAGATPGSVIVRMIANVATYDGSDPAGLTSQLLFNNRVSVAQHYAEAGGGVDGATAILLPVTSDPATATAVIHAIDTAGVNAPVFSGATVNGGTLVMAYADGSALDATHVPAVGAFAVVVNGTARAVSSVAVDAAAKTVTLTLASPVTNGQTVTVAYTDPTSGNDASAIQDAGGTDAASLAATAVTNNTPVDADFTAPVFSSASVTGASLVLTYSDANALDATHVPAVGAFTVKVAGTTRTVSAVAVDAAAKTVTLTLETAVTSGQAVTVAYADPTTSNDANAIQDAAGNDAASLTTTAVLNGGVDTTGPIFAGATVNGSSLVMTYTDPFSVDPFNPPAPGAFVVKVAGVTRGVSTVTVDSAEGTVTLTLASPVANNQAVTVAYTDPTTADDANAIQDAFGNDAATLATTSVTNATPDTTAPVFASATVNGSTLVMTYTELHELDAVNKPATTAFAVKVAGVARTVNAVAVNATSKTVTLTLASAVTNGQAVTVAYTDPTGGNDASAIQDDSGNDAATLGATAVTNNTPDTTAPVFASATVNGATLVMTYTELTTLDAGHAPAAGAFAVKVGGVARTVDTVSVNAGAKTVTLTLASAVTNGQAVTVAYTDPTGGNDVNAIQDAAGNDAATLAATAVTNNTPVPDTTAPVFASAQVNGNSLVLTYTELNLLDATNIPAAGAFAVLVNAVSDTVNTVAVDANAKTVTLTLATAVTNGQTVTVAYTDPTAGNDVNAIQDASGNDAADLTATAVTNVTAFAPDFGGLIGVAPGFFFDGF
ncbi:SwmB domain-containing protein [Ramlibacter sp. PS4R-6]|uniref:SwmB domain-containing protein n=1 Tax=Ramlibacter sp. PS4R-6 TaxID=3133438 RepID=UPI0030A5FF2B